MSVGGAASPHQYLQSLQPLAMRFGLERMERALDALGRPDRRLAILHVAGTNGKGSTCAMAAQALLLAGHRTGLYTSPHLARFNERIALDGAPVSDDELAGLVARVRAACPWHDGGDASERLTYFEFATLLALVHFAERGAGAVVLEVGLGGRFDATNAVLPLACAVSRIGLDHVELLGGTLDAIAREKAGIFKPGVPAVVAHAQAPEAMAALRAEAARRGTPLEVAPAGYAGRIALAGRHQEGNAALAAAALRAGARASCVYLAHPNLAALVPVAGRGRARVAAQDRVDHVRDVLVDGHAIPVLDLDHHIKRRRRFALQH
jgi:dihydrofolate synthase/folylpolyglutamate synthase